MPRATEEKKLMKFIKQAMTALLSISLASVGSVSLAQDQDFTQVEIQTVPVTENIYMLTGEGGNIGVSVGDDGVLLIDDQFAPLTTKIEDAVSQISDRSIKFLLNTHWQEIILRLFLGMVLCLTAPS